MIRWTLIKDVVFIFKKDGLLVGFVEINQGMDDSCSELFSVFMR